MSVTHRFIQFSDAHLLGPGRLLCDQVDCQANLVAAFERVARSGLRVDAFILSGDLADSGDRMAYRGLRTLINQQSARFGCPILPGIGNHDAQEPFTAELMDGVPATSSIDYACQVHGMRIIHLDSHIPGDGRGQIRVEQVRWLEGLMGERAAHGSILVMHHPPAPTSSQVLEQVSLINPEALEPAVTSGDIRLILCGHWHAACTTSFAGVPVHISGALSYQADPLNDPAVYRGTTGGQSFSMVEVHDSQIVTTVIPLTSYDTLRQVEAGALRDCLATSRARGRAQTADPSSREHA